MTAGAGTDEVGDLTRAFATMQDRLREQEEVRRAFVATASHELRTPLAALRLTLDLAAAQLHDAGAPAQAGAAQVQRAQGQADRLSRLADELLELSRLDAGVPMRRELVELGELARAVTAELTRPPPRATSRSRCSPMARRGSRPTPARSRGSLASSSTTRCASVPRAAGSR